MHKKTKHILKSYVISLPKTGYTWLISLPPMTMITNTKIMSTCVNRVSRKERKYYNGQYFDGRTL